MSSIIPDYPLVIKSIQTPHFPQNSEQDLSQIVVQFVSINGEKIPCCLENLRPWPNLFIPFTYTSFKEASTDERKIETDSEIILCLVDFFNKLAKPIFFENCFASLENYLNSPIIEEHKEKEKNDEDNASLQNHPLEKICEIYRVADLYGISEIIDFSKKYIQNENFLNSIEQKKINELKEYINGDIPSNFYKFIWNIVFHRACMDKNHEDVKFLFDSFIKKFGLDRLQEWLSEIDLSGISLLLILKMILLTEEKNSEEFDTLFNFAVVVLEDYYSHVFVNTDTSETNIQFFYSLFSLAAAVQTPAQGARLLKFFVFKPPAMLNYPLQVTKEEKDFLKNNGVFAFDFNYRESIVLLILFQKISETLTKNGNHPSILTLLKQVCYQINWIEEYRFGGIAIPEVEKDERYRTIMSCLKRIFHKILTTSETMGEYLTNLELLLALRNSRHEWLPSFKGNANNLFDQFYFISDENFYQYKHFDSFKEQELQKALSMARKMSSHDLILLRPLLLAIKNNLDPKLKDLKTLYSSDIIKILNMVGKRTTKLKFMDPEEDSDCGHFITLVKEDKIENALDLFKSLNKKVKSSLDFFSILSEKISLEKIFKFAENLNNSERNSFFKNFFRFLIKRNKWTDVLTLQKLLNICNDKSLDALSIKYLVKAFRYVDIKNTKIFIEITDNIINRLNNLRCDSIDFREEMSYRILNILDALIEGNKKEELIFVLQFSSLRDNFFEKKHILEINERVLAARLLLGEGKEAIEHLKESNSELDCLTHLGNAVIRMNTAHLHPESLEALCSFAFKPDLIKRIELNPKNSLTPVYPFLLKNCCTLAEICKNNGNDELLRRVLGYIQTIVNLQIPSSTGIAELFILTKNVEWLLARLKKFPKHEIRALFEQIGILLAESKNHQFFLTLAKKCNVEDFHFLAEAYFRTSDKIVDGERADVMNCPSSFFNALFLSLRMPLKSLHN